MNDQNVSRIERPGPMDEAALLAALTDGVDTAGAICHAGEEPQGIPESLRNSPSRAMDAVTRRPNLAGVSAESVNPDAAPVDVIIRLPSGREVSISSNLLIVDQNREGGAIADLLRGQGVPFYQALIMRSNEENPSKRSSESGTGLAPKRPMDVAYSAVNQAFDGLSVADCRKILSAVERDIDYLCRIRPFSREEIRQYWIRKKTPLSNPHEEQRDD